MRKTEDKSQPIVLLLLACVLIFAMYFWELFNGIFKTLLSKTSADEIKNLIIFIPKLLIYIAAFTGIAISALKYADTPLFTRKQHRLHPKYAVMIFVLTFAAVFFSCWAIGFDLPVVKEVGASSTTEKVIETLSRSYLPYLFRTILAVMLIALFQNFFESAFPAKYIKYIPFGGIVVFLTCGIAELFISTDLALIWAYWIFYLFYGMVYVLSEKRLILTLLLALIVIIF